MTRLQWLTCWDRLRDQIGMKTLWGKNELLNAMDNIEREEIRKAEAKDDCPRPPQWVGGPK